jgi:hypothetical protein
VRRDDLLDAHREGDAVAQFRRLALAAGRQGEGDLQDLRREALQLLPCGVTPWALIGRSSVTLTPALAAASASEAPPWRASSKAVAWA